MEIKSLSFFICLSTLCGCIVVDEHPPVHLLLPAVLEVHNSTNEKLSITSMAHSAETSAGFVIKNIGDVISSTPTKTRIRESAYDAIGKGHFWMHGSCGNIQNWKLKGTDGLQKNLLSIKAIDNETEWKVSININRCE